MSFDQHQIDLERHQQRIANGMKYTTMEAYRLEQDKALNGKYGEEEVESRGVATRFRRALRRLFGRR